MHAEREIREINALMRLIDEPDSAVYLEISKKIHSYGTTIVPFLETAWENTHDPFLQSRIEMLIRYIQTETVKNELQDWINNGARDLLQACLIIARYRYPSLDETDMETVIARIRKDIWLEINENLTALEQIKVFNHIFYDLHGFTGDTRNYHAPDNSYLNTVLQSKKGNPLSLGILYMIIAQSLDIPVVGVNLPEHFVLAYMTSEYDRSTGQLPTGKPLFYINAFSSGVIFNQQEIDNFLRHLGHEPSADFYKTPTNRDLITRMLNNLINSYTKEGDKEKAADILSLRQLLTQQGPP